MPMTKQEVFDTVATHLLTQQARAEDEDQGYCLYRGPAGRKCAVGCLIPDEVYEERFEQLDIGKDYRSSRMETEEHVAERIATQRDLNECVSKIFPDLAFLRELQKIHDYKYISSWRDELAALAEEHDLSSAVLDNFPACETETL